jgi:hypothetical protein
MWQEITWSNLRQYAWCFAWLLASATLWIRSALFCNCRQRRMVVCEQRFGTSCRFLLQGISDCVALELGTDKLSRNFGETPNLCCVISKNSTDLMRVLSGGTGEHHKSPVNTVRLRFEIWNCVFRTCNESATNTVTLNVKNLKNHSF